MIGLEGLLKSSLLHNDGIIRHASEFENGTAVIGYGRSVEGGFHSYQSSMDYYCIINEDGKDDSSDDFDDSIWDTDDSNDKDDKDNHTDNKSSRRII